jgi:hypothetical protein
MGLLDPNDPKNPLLPAELPPLRETTHLHRTLSLLEPNLSSSKPSEFVDVHMYRCRDHWVFRLTSQGLEPELH